MAKNHAGISFLLMVLALVLPFWHQRTEQPDQTPQCSPATTYRIMDSHVRPRHQQQPLSAYPSRQGQGDGDDHNKRNPPSTPTQRHSAKTRVQVRDPHGHMIETERTDEQGNIFWIDSHPTPRYYYFLETRQHRRVFQDAITGARFMEFPTDDDQVAWVRVEDANEDGSGNGDSSEDGHGPGDTSQSENLSRSSYVTQQPNVRQPNNVSAHYHHRAT